MRMIKRSAIALGLGSALVLGHAGITVAAPTANPAAPVVLTDDDNDGLLGILGGDSDHDGDDDDDDDDSLGDSLNDADRDDDVLGDDDDVLGHDDDSDDSVSYRCDDDENDGGELLDLDGLNLVAVLEGVNVLGLDLGDCDDDDEDHDGVLGAVLEGLLGG